MPIDTEPDMIMSAVLGNITAVLLDGDGATMPPSEDHYLAFIGGGIPMRADSFNYALEGFGGVTRKNLDRTKPEASVGPQSNPSQSTGEITIAQDSRRKYAA